MKKSFAIFILLCLSVSARAETAVGTPKLQCLRYKGDLNVAATRSAYPTAPFQPSGSPYAYVALAWRESIMSETTHTLAVARSKNLKDWEDSCGKSIPLPLKLETTEVIDQIDPGQGFINNVKIGEDLHGQPVVTYMKFVNLNGQKTTQVFNARLVGSTWKISQMTHWTTAWNFSGGGSLGKTDESVNFGPVTIDRHGRLSQAVTRAKADKTGSPATGTYEVLDQDSDLILASAPMTAVPETDKYFMSPPALPANATVPRPQPAGFVTKFAIASLAPHSTEAVDTPRKWFSHQPEKSYLLIWDALPSDGDVAYDCNGKSSKSNQGVRTLDKCSEKFVRTLMLWSYSEATKAWVSEKVDDSWGGMRVGFDFLTFKDRLLVAYYNKDRKLTLASRQVSGGPWTVQPLDSVFKGWDSHNTITMVVDANDDLHVSGNHHVNPLNYFRGSALDVTKVQKLQMTGLHEDKATYPTFFRSPQGELTFSYRNGSSGDGDTWLNGYNLSSKTWSKLTTQPLFSGNAK